MAGSFDDEAVELYLNKPHIPYKLFDTYFHPFIDQLNKNCTIKIANWKNGLNICIYSINNDGISPFIQFLLFKEGDVFKMMKFYKETDDCDIVQEASDCITDILNSQINDVKFKGLIEYYSSKVLFFECILQNQTDMFSLDQECEWVTVREIINDRKYLDIDIDIFFVDMLLETKVHLLTDVLCEEIQPPEIWYICDCMSIIQIIIDEGIHNRPNSLCGEVMDTCVQFYETFDTVKKNGNNELLGFAKCAIFPGKSKLVKYNKLTTVFNIKRDLIGALVSDYYDSSHTDLNMFGDVIISPIFALTDIRRCSILGFFI